MTITADVIQTDHDQHYGELLPAFRKNFLSAVDGHEAVFTTDVSGLFDTYLDHLPGERQQHNCHTCRRFFEQFGGLVTVSDVGITEPVMWGWEDVPPFYVEVFSRLHLKVAAAKVTGVFLNKNNVWGTPVTGEWHHLAVEPPARLIYRERAQSAEQAMSTMKERVRIVSTALGEFKPEVITRALRILQADAVHRAEKFVSPLQWLLALYQRPKGVRGSNALWKAVATAPEGYCHPRSSVTGSLLEDLTAGMAIDDVTRRFNAKMHPLQYQRPQAAPAAGNIKAAEALIEKLGVGKALERRMAGINDVVLTWQPKVKAPVETKGLFGHLKPKNADESFDHVVVRGPTMTWDKFSRTILPGAEQIKILVPSQGQFIGVTTAQHADAPPIMKWDSDDKRNPVAWYVYPRGSQARQWGLSAGSFTPVVGITPFPTLLGQHPMPELADGVILIIEGAKDDRKVYGAAGNALFPECLKSELHAARATIEAYSRTATLGNVDGQSASGYDLRRHNASAMLRVYANGGWSEYRIDRWD